MERKNKPVERKRLVSYGVIFCLVRFLGLSSMTDKFTLDS